MRVKRISREWALDKNRVGSIWFKVSIIIGSENIRSRWTFDVFDEKLYIDKKKISNFDTYIYYNYNPSEK